MPEQPQFPRYKIQPWRKEFDIAAFSSGMEKIDYYISEQAHREMTSHVSLVFVLTEFDSNVVIGFYSLSAVSVVFDTLPKNVQRSLPRYQSVGATLLGRLGVDRQKRAQIQAELGENPRLGELLLIDAQKKALEAAVKTVGSALMIIDVLLPTDAELAAGVRDPLTFYSEYGFLPFPGLRRVFKPMRTIEEEYRQA